MGNTIDSNDPKFSYKFNIPLQIQHAVTNHSYCSESVNSGIKLDNSKDCPQKELTKLVEDEKVQNNSDIIKSPMKLACRYNLVVNGYLRQINKHLMVDDVNKLILMFCIPSYNVRIQQNSLQQALKQSKHESYVTQIFWQRLNDYQQIYFFVVSDSDKIYAQIEFLDGVISSCNAIIACIELRCEQLQFYGKHVKKYIHTETFLCLEICDIKRWERFNLNEELVFILNVEIFDTICIESGEIPALELNDKIKVSKNTIFEWIVDDKLLNEFKNAARDTSFYSNNFNENENFCLEFIPCDGNGNCRVGLSVIKLPIGIHSLKIDYELFMNNERIWKLHGDNAVIFDHSYEWQYGMGPVMSNSGLYSLKELKIQVVLTVGLVFKYNEDMKAIIVPKWRWKQYDIQ